MKNEEVHPVRIKRKRTQRAVNNERFGSERNGRREELDFSRAYREGYDAGYDEGYMDGYNDGYSDHEYNSRNVLEGNPQDQRWHKRKSWSWYWL